MNPTPMTLRLELFVNDVSASVDFYTRVLRFEALKGWGQYVPVRLGAVTLGLGPASGLSPEHYFRPEVTGQRWGLGVEIVLEVPDVEDVYRHVQAQGYPIQTPLKERPWGLTDFRIADPDGYFLRITSRRGG